MSETKEKSRHGSRSSYSSRRGRPSNESESSMSVEEFKAELLNVLEQLLEVAQEAGKSDDAERLQAGLMNLKFSFKNFKFGEELLTVANGMVVHTIRIKDKFEKDAKVGQKEKLKEIQTILMKLNHWIDNYPNEQGHDGRKNGPAEPGDSAGFNNLETRINALEVKTVTSLDNNLEKLNDFLKARPTIEISLDQFNSLFDKLDSALKILPESKTQLHPELGVAGLSQREIIARMMSINEKTNWLYGFLKGRKIK